MIAQRGWGARECLSSSQGRAWPSVRPRGAPGTSPARPASLFPAFQPRFEIGRTTRERFSSYWVRLALTGLGRFPVGAVGGRRSEGRAGEVPGAPRGLRPSAGGNRGGVLCLLRTPSPTSGGAGGDWYTTANSLQFGALVCSESSVVYPAGWGRRLLHGGGRPPSMSYCQNRT